MNEQLLIKISDYVKYLSLMAVQKANSGHPGLPLGCARLGVMLYSYFVKGSANNPTCPNRDRFILSAGHGSMLLYALNHIFGYKISLSDIVNFRQLGSVSAGHPEYELDKGLETTTGPLGQGIANAVGVAIESKMLASRFNNKKNLFDYNVYALLGDGCMMEGISYEASSVAGHLGLDNLIAIYDSNQISIDGSTNITFTENVKDRYIAQGWLVKEANSNDLQDIFNKLNDLKSATGKPKLLILETIIGEGLDKMSGTHKIHGAPAGIEEIAFFLNNSSIKEVLTQKNIDNTIQFVESQLQDGRFLSLQEVLNNNNEFNTILETRKSYTTEWEDKFTNYQKENPNLKQQLATYLGNQKSLPNALKEQLISFQAKPSATRNVSAEVLKICCEHLENIVGGSADLVGSTKASVSSSLPNSGYLKKDDFSGRNIAFGVREHAMGSIGNGLALSRYFIPFTSTFFTFFDYMKPSVRLAAIMNLKHLFVFTHDSFYVGEDGPTHQPIEHLGAIRLIPNIYTMRPCNDSETAFSYLYFLENQGPVAIIATRQGLSGDLFEQNKNTEEDYKLFLKGGYVFIEDESNLENIDIVLAASGSEMSQAIKLKNKLNDDGKKVRVVSLPCIEKLEEQGQEYLEKLFGNGTTPVYFLETASHRGFKLFYKNHIQAKTMNSFGASAKDKDVEKHFGFDTDSLYEETQKLLQ